MTVAVINQQGQTATYTNIKSFQINEKSLTMVKKEGETLQTLISLSKTQFSNVQSVAVIV